MFCKSFFEKICGGFCGRFVNRPYGGDGVRCLCPRQCGSPTLRRGEILRRLCRLRMTPHPASASRKIGGCHSRLAVPGKHFGLKLFLVFSDRCGKSALPSSATGSGSTLFSSRRRLWGTGSMARGARAVLRQNCLREQQSCDILRGILACGAWRGRAKEKKERKRRDGAL